MFISVSSVPPWQFLICHRGTESTEKHLQNKKAAALKRIAAFLLSAIDYNILEIVSTNSCLVIGIPIILL